MVAAVAVVAWAAPTAASPRTVPVAIVVDFGPHGLAPRVATKCLRVPAGSNGTDVLAQWAQDYGLPPTVYAPSGLLCAIDGYPRRGCGTAVGSRYAYWSYWHGGGQWTYASVGPAEFTVTTDDVEGWRFQPDGTASPQDPPPDAPASYAAVCAEAAVAPFRSPTGTVGALAIAEWSVAGVAVVALGALTARRARRSAR